MIQTSPAFRAAVVGSPRRVDILAVVDLSDPDLTWEPMGYDSLAPWCVPEQLHDHELDPPARYAALERGRWLLGGGSKVFPDGYQVKESMGFANDALSGPDGTFSPAAWVEERFAHVRILQTVSIYFSTDPADGVPMDFTVEVRSGDTVYFTKTFTGNRATEVSIDGFTVQQPTAIRLTCTRWSLPSRRMRAVEIMTGLYERWGPRMLASFSCVQQGEFSCLSLPYGSVTLAMDNKSRRFEPRRKDSIFASIEERQGVEVYIGVRVASGAFERVKLGLFYMAGDGWKTSQNEPTMQWYLVDIIGLLSGRTFLPPETLPTTLAGWLEAIVSQLGVNFTNRWSCDPAYAGKPVTANSREDVTGKSCGEMIRWACQASGTWPRADAETGKLCAEPLWHQGNKLALANLTGYPGMKANQSLAALIFTLSDGTEYVVSGNSTSSEKTVAIRNPFLHTQAQALAAARLILSQYGGNVIETTGRGGPSGEIGDVDTVWLDESSAVTARRKSQTIQFQDGMMQGCRSTLLQADGSYLWEERTVLTGSGTWTGPSGVGRLRLFLVGRGGDGTAGTAGSYDAPGEDGTDGLGGLVWAGVVDINPGQSFAYRVDQDAVFGVWTSAEGQQYPQGYSDIASGESYARTGVQAPLEGSGDGGAGGKGGSQGVRHRETVYNSEGKPSGSRWVVDVRPGPAEPGVPGTSGCIVIYWDKTAP